MFLYENLLVFYIQVDIFHAGVDQEGIFRVSGSAKAVDKLKTAFNTLGDADLDGEMDIMAIAGLLKLFLRDLPDSLIPEHLTQEFIAIQTGKYNALYLIDAFICACMYAQTNRCTQTHMLKAEIDEYEPVLRCYIM